MWSVAFSLSRLNCTAVSPFWCPGCSDGSNSKSRSVAWRLSEKIDRSRSADNTSKAGTVRLITQVGSAWSARLQGAGGR